MNIPISLKDAIFKEEQFKYYEECGKYLMPSDPNMSVQGVNTDKKVPTKNLITVVLVDPAKTINLSSADSATVVVSIDRFSRKIFVRNVVSKKVRPEELYNIIFENILMYKASFLGVELTGLNEFILQPLKTQMKLRNVYPILVEINATKNKDLRIATALAPHYNRGYVYHNKANCTALENQLKWHPKGKSKDIIDAFANINKVIDSQNLYFSSEDDYDEDDEYHDLYESDNLQIDMREYLTV